MDFTERLQARRGQPWYHAAVPSPDGSMLAWISDRDGRPRAWVGAADGPEPEGPVADLADVGALAWSPDGAWLACQVAPGGGERTQVFLVDLGTGEVRDLAPGAAATTLGAW